MHAVFIVCVKLINKLLSTIFFDSIIIPLYVIKTDNSAKIHTPGKGGKQNFLGAAGADIAEKAVSRKVCTRAVFFRKDGVTY